MRVSKVDLRRFERSLRGLQVGDGLARGVLFLVVIALGDGVIGKQALCTRSVGGRIAVTRLRRCNLRRGACDFRFVRTRVDGKERVTLLHERAVLEVHRDDRAGHERANVDMVHRFETARIALPVRDGLRDHRGHVHFGGGRAMRGGLRLVDGVAVTAPGGITARASNDDHRA